MVQFVATESGQTLGSLVTEAIRFWYKSLPEPVEDADLVELQTQVLHFRGLVEQLCQLLRQTDVSHHDTRTP